MTPLLDHGGTNREIITKLVAPWLLTDLSFKVRHLQPESMELPRTSRTH
jgi:hypothetical protein